MSKSRLAASVTLSCILVIACGPASREEATAAEAPPANVPSVQSGGQALPPEVGQWVQAARQECLDAGGRFAGAADFILRGEFNADGRVDYLLLGSGLNCSVDLGGPQGPRNDFLISSPGGGYSLYGGFPAFDLTARQVVRRNDRDVIVLEGTWFRSGGEVHRVLWGWNGEEVTVVERQNAAGRPVDENGHEIPAKSAVASGARSPFREGFWVTGEAYPVNRGNGWENLHDQALELSGSTLVRHNTADADVCRIVDRSVRGAETRLTFQCLVSCGNGGDGPCPERYDPQRHTAAILPLDTDRIRLRVETATYDYWNGDYTYHGSSW